MTQESSSGQFIQSIQKGIEYLKEGRFAVLWKAFRNRLYSHTLFFGLRRELDKPFLPPNAKIDISIRPLQEGDLEQLLENGKFHKKHPKLAAYQESIVRANIPTCYVAVTSDGDPCYMQWLIGSRENNRIHNHFGDTFPPLKDNEALLEAAFMKRTFRGQHIMPAAMARIAEKGKDIGATRALTFVGCGNIPALKGCRRAGFTPYIVRRERWVFFRKHVSFSAIPKAMLEQYEEEVGRVPAPQAAMAGE